MSSSHSKLVAININDILKSTEYKNIYKEIDQLFPSEPEHKLLNILSKVIAERNKENQNLKEELSQIRKDVYWDRW